VLNRRLPVHASENAKEHANENSAVFDAKSETTSSNEVKADKKSVSGKSEMKSKNKVKASKH
jgi:hypothetical protein